MVAIIVVVVVIVVVVFLYLVRGERESDKKGEKWIDKQLTNVSHRFCSTKNARARVVLETRDI
jgi:uncharacterized membrane protein